MSFIQFLFVNKISQQAIKYCSLVYYVDAVVVIGGLWQDMENHNSTPMINAKHH